MTSHKLDGWFRGRQKRKKVEGEGAIDSNPLKTGDAHEMDDLADRLIIASNHVNKQSKHNFISVWYSHQKYLRRHTDEDNSSSQKRPTWFPPSTPFIFKKVKTRRKEKGIGMTTYNWAERRSTRTFECLLHRSLNGFIETRKERRENEREDRSGRFSFVSFVRAKCED